MSPNPNSFELPNVILTSGDNDTALDARLNLSSFAVGSMKEARSGGATASDAVEAAATNAANGLAETGSGIFGQLENNVAGKVVNRIEHQVGDSDNGMISERIGTSGLSKLLNAEVTDKDREKAKKTLAGELSPLIPEADRKVLIEMQGALVDGDLNKLKETLKGLSGDPEKLAKYVKAINDQFNKHESFGGLELSMDGKGNVLVYENHGNTAVSINPKSGETTLRAVEHQKDGSVVLKDGEIINRQAGDVMKAIGDAATRSVASPWADLEKIQPIPMPEIPRWKVPHEVIPNFEKLDFKSSKLNPPESARRVKTNE